MQRVKESRKCVAAENSPGIVAHPLLERKERGEEGPLFRSTDYDGEGRQVRLGGRRGRQKLFCSRPAAAACTCRPLPPSSVASPASVARNSKNFLVVLAQRLCCEKGCSLPFESLVKAEGDPYFDVLHLTSSPLGGKAHVPLCLSYSQFGRRKQKVFFLIVVKPEPQRNSRQETKVSSIMLSS